MPNDIYDMYAAIFKALAHPTRLRILEILATYGEMCVCNIADKLNIDQPAVSKHLAVLKNVGIIESRKQGLTVNYKVRMPCVVNFLKCADEVLEADLKSRYSFINGKEMLR
ncbi:MULTISPECIES: ArsR/SmtB family transcription factor [Thermosediminibacter]|uniref:Transcriptional regulator, ArsR family n=2 Tax=Thermosediminibacter TaxID=291988 RepID=D9RZR9_THEOJ|nr:MULTISPECIES: metalloregulator ArsR/SmtB family transcription factor [Thermosediminibacter]ADL08696.1 transcriptional regulator, ArsR family [Thermosediminibacter oceani DSM 16646]TYP58854.1 ArsR family transcriptional regulator [Thermosediminibacter litoriperuensis]